MIATTKAVVLRGTTTDALGDEIDSTTPVGDPFPISIIERDAQEFDEASNEWRTVRKLIGRVSNAVDVANGDRIRDERDGRIYAVDSVERTPRGISGRSSVRITLKRTGS